MTDDGGYDLADHPPSRNDPPKPGDPAWTPPVPIIEKADPSADQDTPPDPDIEQHKGLALLGYIFFPIPLLAAPKSPFARYHANQGLLAFLALMLIIFLIVVLEIARWIIASFLPIPILRLFFSCGFYLLEVAMLIGWIALVIKGILSAVDGKRTPLPVIGHWELIR